MDLPRQIGTPVANRGLCRGLSPAIAGGAKRKRLWSLVAYEGWSQAASSWSFDVDTYLRFGLYVAVGVGSWVGAALAERLLDTALD